MHFFFLIFSFFFVCLRQANERDALSVFLFFFAFNFAPVRIVGRLFKKKREKRKTKARLSFFLFNQQHMKNTEEEVHQRIRERFENGKMGCGLTSTTLSVLGNTDLINGINMLLTSRKWWSASCNACFILFSSSVDIGFLQAEPLVFAV